MKRAKREIVVITEIGRTFLMKDETSGFAR
jgi:hypothetical protein